MPNWVPKDMQWFLADMIQELKIADEETSTVWINTILIHASSLEEAYAKSVDHGKQYENTYTNTDGALVTSRFRGLRNLLLIYEKLEHGSEIMWEENEDQTEEDIQNMITPKTELGVFVTHGPNAQAAASDGGTSNA